MWIVRIMKQRFIDFLGNTLSVQCLKLREALTGWLLMCNDLPNHYHLEDPDLKQLSTWISLIGS